eukprot:Ihof_evm1s647 gene=Ihof_evmTU1s647
MGGKLVKAEKGSQDIKLSQKDVAFLKQVFKHMARRSPKDTMNKETFLQYFPLNGMLGERLFMTFDHKNNNVIDLGEFISGLTVILAGTAAEKCRFIYTMFNLDNDDGVSREELKIMLISMLSSAMDIVKVLGMDNIPEDIPEDTHLANQSRLSFSASVARQLGSPYGNNDYLTVEAVGNRINIIEEKRSWSSIVMNKKMSARSSTQSIPSPKGYINHQELEQIVETLLDKAFSTCDVTRTGKLNYVEFSNWVETNPAVLDTIFGRKCFQYHRFDHLLEHADQTARKGYLSKSRANPLRSWKTRHYVLRGQFLYYYNKEELSQAVGAIFMSGVEVFMVDFRNASLKRMRSLDTSTSPDRLVAKPTRSLPPSSNDEEKHSRWWGIELIQGKRRMVFRASSYEDAYEWYEAISHANAIVDIRDVYDFDEETPLGKGSFAIVYRGTHKYTHHKVAIKVINKQHLDTIEREGMLAEISILKLANHHNVIDLYEIYDTVDTLYLVIELCEGGEMLDLFKKGRMPEQKAMRLVKQMFQGIRYLHDIGIVHRDIKPSNILLSTDDPNTQVAKIVDFGLSKFVHPSEKVGDSVGTLKYNAPEVINDRSYNKPVDIWSAGIIVYILLTGRFPFNVKSRYDLVDAITHARFDKTCPEYTSLSVDARILIENLLQVDPGA